MQQTELAFLTPPAPKVKSRFMNLERQLIWARHVLANLRDPTTVSEFATPERLQEKFGWMEAFESDVVEWLQWQQVVDVAVTLVNSNGIYQGAADLIAGQLSKLDALQDSAEAWAASWSHLFDRRKPWSARANGLREARRCWSLASVNSSGSRNSSLEGASPNCCWGSGRY